MVSGSILVCYLEPESMSVRACGIRADFLILEGGKIKCMVDDKNQFSLEFWYLFNFLLLILVARA